MSSLSPLIIGFSGKMGSGKDYIAKEVVGNYLRSNGIQYIHIAFSDALKVQLMATDGVSFEALYVKKTAVSRKLLQQRAMEMRKDNDNIWINYLDAWITVYGSRNAQVVLISDVRFPIEMEYIKKKGGIIFRIIAPMRTMKKMEEETGNNVEEIEKIKGHISETAFDSFDNGVFHMVLYNDNDNAVNIMPQLIEPLLRKLSIKEKMA